MKKLFTLLALAITLIATAQAPQGFNYQATVRNTAGELLLNQSVSFKFSILQNSDSGDIVYSENQTAITDDLGHINLVVGQGTATTGTFGGINWASGTYFLGIELNTGAGYVAMGTTQLLSVPYALYANTAGNSQASTPNLGDVLAVNNGANNLQIKNLANPTDAQDAVTKGYVQNLVSQINSIPPGNNNGEMLYWNGANWVNLNQGANGQILTYCNGEPKWTTGGVCPPQEIGDIYQGGKIIYIFQPGDSDYVQAETHGLIIPISAITTTPSNWATFIMGEYGCLGSTIGNTLSSLGSGIANTNSITTNCTSNQSGAYKCKNLTIGGYSDWFLPSKNEVAIIYQNYTAVGGVYPIQSQGVWCSTEINSNYAWVCSFDGGGGWVSLPKDYVFNIKPLRKF